MKTKEKDEKENQEDHFLIGFVLGMLILAIIISIPTINLKHHLTQSNLTIAQEHSQILNLTHSLAQQKAQITNLTNLLNLNESQVIFNKPISIAPSILMSTCNTYGCSSYPSAANTTLYFNFSHAGYIVINTTGQSYVFLLLMQNYSRTWSGVNDSGAAGTFNFSVRSLTMPVLPGPASLKLFYYNATVPYEAQLTITYHS